MSRKSFDPDEDTPPLPQSAPGEKRLPCRTCGKATLIVTLTNYGTRCFGCYEAYCGEPQQKSMFLADKRRDTKAWARALKAREEAGDRLSPAQRTMWREALKFELARHQHADEGVAS